MSERDRAAERASAVSDAMADIAEIEPRVQHEVVVERGSGVAMLGDDVHSIHIEGAATNFHCYGLALERLNGRRFWHARSGEWRAYKDVGHIVEARPGRASPAST